MTKSQNTLETCVLLDDVRTADGERQFKARVIQDTGQYSDHQHPESILIQVEYNSLWPISTGLSQQQRYFCIGKEIGSHRWVAGMSVNLGSMIRIFEVRDLPSYSLDRRSLAAIIPPMMSALALPDLTCDHGIVIVEPDPTFLRCLRWVFRPGRAPNGWALHVWTTSPHLAEEDCDVKYIHPRSSVWELKQYFPRSHAVVLDFLPKERPISQAVEKLAGGCDYFRWPWLLQRAWPRPIDQSQDPVSHWIHAFNTSIHLATLQSMRKVSSTFKTPAQLLSTHETISKLTVVDWNADRLVPLQVKPIVESRLFHPNRTYILVGLTRDLGHSLCRLCIQHGAQNIVVASRNPDKSPAWVSELKSEGATILVERLDVTNLEDVKLFKARLKRDMPSVGGIINGAMVLDDGVFAKMDIDTWKRVLQLKTAGSKNLDIVFSDDQLGFFIMTSSFAAIGGHAGQSNYAAANMYMNELAAEGRRRGLAGSVLNIGVIYGLGLLAREKQGIYAGLEKEGYPPISERDIHHMFLEAIVAGRPVAGQIMDLTTGLARYRVNDPDPLHWHHDRRSCHYTVHDDVDGAGLQQDTRGKQVVKELIGRAASDQDISDIVVEHLCRYLAAAHKLPKVTGENNIVELGLDSLAAVEIRNWFYKSVGRDVAVLKIVSSTSIVGLCDGIARKIMEDR